MSPVLLSRSSIISTSTSITRTARIRTMKVLPRYQVNVRDGKKSNSTGRLRARRRPETARALASLQQRASTLGQFGIGAFERADRLAAGNECHAIIHPRDQDGEHYEGPPERKQRIDPTESCDFLPILIDLVIRDYHDDRHEHAQRRRRPLRRYGQRHG